MKKIMLLCAAGVAMLAGCASNGTAPKLTPAQIAAIICPNVQTELATLSAAGVFTGGAAATLQNQVQPDVAAVCAAGAAVTVANLQTLSSATVPVVIAAVNASSMSADDKKIAILAVGGIQTSLATALAVQAATASAASAPAVAVPASAASGV